MLLIILRILLLVYMGYDLYRIFLSLGDEDANPNLNRWYKSLFISVILFIVSFLIRW